MGDTPLDTAKMMSIDFNGNVKNLASNLAVVAATTGDERALKMLDVMREVGAKDTQSLSEALSFKLLHAKDPEEIAMAKAQIKKVKELRESMQKPTKETALIKVQEEMTKASRNNDAKAYEYWKQKRIDLIKKPKDESIEDTMKRDTYNEDKKKGMSAGDSYADTKQKGKAMSFTEQMSSNAYKEMRANGKTHTQAAQAIASSVLKAQDPKTALQQKIVNMQMHGQDTTALQNLNSSLFGGGNALKQMVSTAISSGDTKAVQNILDTVHTMNDKPLEGAVRQYMYKLSQGDKAGAQKILDSIQGAVTAKAKPTAPRALNKQELAMKAAGGDPDAIKALSIMNQSDNGSLVDTKATVAGGYNSITKAISGAKATEQPGIASAIANEIISSAGADLDLVNNPDLLAGNITPATQKHLDGLRAAQNANSKAHTSSSVYVSANKTVEGARGVVNAVNKVHKIYNEHKDFFSRLGGTAANKIMPSINRALSSKATADNVVGDMEKLAVMKAKIDRGEKLTRTERGNYNKLKNSSDMKAFTDMDTTSFLALKSLLQSISGMGVTNKEFESFQERFKGKGYESMDTMLNALDSVVADQIPKVNAASQDLMGQGAYYDAYMAPLDIRRAGADFLPSSGIDVTTGIRSNEPPKVQPVSPYNSQVKQVSTFLGVKREDFTGFLNTVKGTDKAGKIEALKGFIKTNNLNADQKTQLLAYVNGGTF